MHCRARCVLRPFPSINRYTMFISTGFLPIVYTKFIFGIGVAFVSFIRLWGREFPPGIDGCAETRVGYCASATACCTLRCSNRSVPRARAACRPLRRMNGRSACSDDRLQENYIECRIHSYPSDCQYLSFTSHATVEEGLELLAIHVGNLHHRVV